MPLPERVGDDYCGLAVRWVLDAHLAQMVVELERMAQDRFTTSWFRWPGIWVISGYRSPERQAEVNPSVPRSCHVQCPSLAVDLRVGAVDHIESREVWAILGGMWELMGGRWGGRFSNPSGAEDFINEKEMNHFDLGPCM